MATGTLFYPPQSTPLSASGSPQAGMYACFFATGTLTPATVYANGTLATPLSQPTPGSVNPSAGTVANGAGVLPVIYVSPSQVYRVQLYTAAGVLISDTDPWFITGAAATSFASGSAAAPGIGFSAASGTGLYVPNANSLGFATDGIAAGSISASQAWSLPAATGANTLTVAGGQGNYAGVFNGNVTSGSSFGVEIFAGTTNADIALNIANQAGSSTLLQLLGNGELYMQPAPAFTGIAGLQQVGYLEMPVNTQQSGNYQFALTDRGRGVQIAGGSTYTIPANASVAFPVGTVIFLANTTASGSATIAITSDLLSWLPSLATGNRTLAQGGTATLWKYTSNGWRIWGSGLS